MQYNGLQYTEHLGDTHSDEGPRLLVPPPGSPQPAPRQGLGQLTFLYRVLKRGGGSRGSLILLLPQPGHLPHCGSATVGGSLGGGGGGVIQYGDPGDWAILEQGSTAFSDSTDEGRSRPYTPPQNSQTPMHLESVGMAPPEPAGPGPRLKILQGLGFRV